jgi:arylsulfatase A-like enzyme
MYWSGRSSWAVLGILAAASLACAPRTEPLAPTRGYILISLDTLGARYLGAYGSERGASPFFDSLAGQGVLFENAIVQYPSTLVSHISIFTGLYPQQHGVYPPASRLSPTVATLPARLRDYGFHTGAFTEGGYVTAEFGFDRGFDEFSAVQPVGKRQVEKTFASGIEYLKRRGPKERFFLFLHTYAVHDPYQPPGSYDGMYWEGDPPEVPLSFGPFLRGVNLGRFPMPAAGAAYFRAQYEAELRYLDDVLAGFFAELEALGLRDETTIVLTSDHGEEFLDHGRLAHHQVYPESLWVPLVVLHPAGPVGLRVPDLVESVDLAPTLYDLAGVPPPEPIAGHSLRLLLEGGKGPSRATAHAEVRDQWSQETLLVAEGGTLRQVVTSRVLPDGGQDGGPNGEPAADGAWFARHAELDTDRSRLALRLVSFHRPRSLTFSVDGVVVDRFEIGTRWQHLEVELPGSGTRRVVLDADGCDVPAWVGASEDSRCLSVKVAGVDLAKTELFDWIADRAAGHDLSSAEPGLRWRLATELSDTRWDLVAPAERLDLSAGTMQRLRALGYVN